VVLMPEVPGIHPAVLALGNYLVTKGFTVVIPSLFGTPGKPRGGGYALRTIARLCVTREFMAFATDGERPIAKYVRALASDLNNCTPGPGVGVIGMCFTGGFALAAAVDGSVLASVLASPLCPSRLSRPSGAIPDCPTMSSTSSSSVRAAGKCARSVYGSPPTGRFLLNALQH